MLTYVVEYLILIKYLFFFIKPCRCDFPASHLSLTRTNLCVGEALQFNVLCCMMEIIIMMLMMTIMVMMTMMMMIMMTMVVMIMLLMMMITVCNCGLQVGTVAAVKVAFPDRGN